MTNDALGTLLSGEWWQLFFPAIMIALIMFAFNAIGDGLQDAIDPKSSNGIERRKTWDKSYL